MTHVIHYILSRTLDAGCGHFEFYPAQIGHGNDTCKQMASYLAVCPMPQRPCAHQDFILADPEMIFDLPAIKTCFNDITGGPIGIVGDYDVFSEHGLFATDKNGIFPKAHRKRFTGLFKVEFI